MLLPETKPRNRCDWRLLVLDGSSTHLSEAVIARAWINRVYLLYLPAHSSHRTQPCDKGPFAPLKVFYSQEAAWLNYIPGSAPINKRLTIACYGRASEKAMTKRNIRAGFSHTGIVPFNPGKVLASLPSQEEVQGTNQSAPERPIVATPSQQADGVFATPVTTSDVVALRQALLGSESNQLQRNVRAYSEKLSKSMDQAFARIARLEDENQRLQLVNRELQPRKRQRLERRPNEMFSDVIRALGNEGSPSRRRRPVRSATQAKLAAASLLTAAYREEELEH